MDVQISRLYLNSIGESTKTNYETLLDFIDCRFDELSNRIRFVNERQFIYSIADGDSIDFVNNLMENNQWNALSYLDGVSSTDVKSSSERFRIRNIIFRIVIGR